VKIKIKPFFAHLLQQCISNAQHEVIEVVKNSLGDVLFYRIKHPEIDDKTTLIFPDYCTVVEKAQKPKKIYFMLKNGIDHKYFNIGVLYKGKLISNLELVSFTSDDGNFETNFYYPDSDTVDFFTKDQYKAMKAARVRAGIEEEVRAEHDEALENLREEMKSLSQKCNQLRHENESLKNENKTLKKWNEELQETKNIAIEFSKTTDQAYEKLLAEMNEAQETIQKQLVIDGFIGDEFRLIGQCKESQFSEVDGLKLKLDRRWVDAEKLCGSYIYIKVK